VHDARIHQLHGRAPLRRLVRLGHDAYQGYGLAYSNNTFTHGGW
jgi:hypothetical protein